MPSLRVRLPDCKCSPYYPAGPGPHHSSFCSTKRNQKLSDAEAVTYRDLLREARAAGGLPTTHPTTWTDEADAPVEFRWSLAVWQKHTEFGFRPCADDCAHCRFTESQELPDWDLYDKDRKERSDAI